MRRRGFFARIGAALCAMVAAPLLPVRKITPFATKYYLGIDPAFNGSDASMTVMAVLENGVWRVIDFDHQPASGGEG